MDCLGCKLLYAFLWEVRCSFSKPHVVHSDLTSSFCCGNKMIFVFCCIICICSFQSSQDSTAWLRSLSWGGSTNPLTALEDEQPAQAGSLCPAGCDCLLRHSGMRVGGKTCFLWNYWTLTFSLKVLLQQVCHLEINYYTISNAYWLLIN